MKSTFLIALCAAVAIAQNTFYPVPLRDSDTQFVGFGSNLYAFDLPSLASNNVYNFSGVTFNSPASFGNDSLYFSDSNSGSYQVDQSTFNLTALPGSPVQDGLDVGGSLQSYIQSQVCTSDETATYCFYSGTPAYITKQLNGSSSNVTVSLNKNLTSTRFFKLDPESNLLYVTGFFQINRGSTNMTYWTFDTENLTLVNGPQELPNTFISGCPVAPRQCGVAILLYMEAFNGTLSYVWTVAQSAPQGSNVSTYQVNVVSFDFSCGFATATFDDQNGTQPVINSGNCTGNTNNTGLDTGLSGNAASNATTSDYYPVAILNGTTQYVGFGGNFYTFTLPSLANATVTTFPNVTFNAPSAIDDEDVEFTGADSSSSYEIDTTNNTLSESDDDVEDGQPLAGGLTFVNSKLCEADTLGNAIYCFYAGNPAYVTKQLNGSSENTTISLGVNLTSTRFLKIESENNLLYVTGYYSQGRGAGNFTYWTFSLDNFTLTNGPQELLNTSSAGCPVAPRQCGVPVLLYMDAFNGTLTYIYSFAQAATGNETTTTFQINLVAFNFDCGYATALFDDKGTTQPIVNSGNCGTTAATSASSSDSASASVSESSSDVLGSTSGNERK